MTDSQPPDETPPSRSEHSPPSGGTDAAQRQLLARAVRHSNLALKELWLHYFSLGGTAGEYEVDAYINASYSFPTLQHDILAQAVNEMIDSLPPRPRAPFSDDTVDCQAPGSPNR